MDPLRGINLTTLSVRNAQWLIAGVTMFFSIYIIVIVSKSFWSSFLTRCAYAAVESLVPSHVYGLCSIASSSDASSYNTSDPNNRYQNLKSRQASAQIGRNTHGRVAPNQHPVSLTDLIRPQGKDSSNDLLRKRRRRQ